MTKVVVTQLNNQRFFLVYEENELVECHPLQEKQSLQIGNIYLGRVEKVVKNIQSAFIRLDADNVGYLSLDEKPAIILNRQLPKGLTSIAEGDTILVQVEQEPQKMKQARVTSNISLGGNYVALDLSGGRIGVSKKIKDHERADALKGIVQNDVNAVDLKEKYGCVLRTACENAPNEAVLKEYRRFCKEMEEIIHKARFERNTGCIKAGKSEYMALLSDYGMDRIDELKTDLPDVYAELRNDVQEISNLQGVYPELVLYDDADYPLYKLLSLETEIKKLLSKKVWLKSGGFLVIEPTEAMVVIDVNTGKSIGKKDKGNHILKLNLEAAEEITKQLRLRNLSGIIMVDFINMSDTQKTEELLAYLQKELKKDPIETILVDMTKLQLVEITRKKIRQPLKEAFE